MCRCTGRCALHAATEVSVGVYRPAWHDVSNRPARKAGAAGRLGQAGAEHPGPRTPRPPPAGRPGLECLGRAPGDRGCGMAVGRWTPASMEALLDRDRSLVREASSLSRNSSRTMVGPSLQSQLGDFAKHSSRAFKV